MIKGWVKAKYGLPYLLHLAVGFWIYVALFFNPALAGYVGRSA
jgi:hypothetical protein